MLQSSNQENQVNFKNKGSEIVQIFAQKIKIEAKFNADFLSAKLITQSKPKT